MASAQYRLDFLLEKVLPVPQQRSKDCGLCCVLSLLQNRQRSTAVKEAHETNTRTLYASLEKKFPGLLSGASTVELAEPLLADKGFRVAFYSNVIGLDAAHAALPFYDDVDVHKEDTRLKDKTEQLQGLGLRVVQDCLGADALCDHVAAGGAAIVLVDARFLPHASLYLSMQPSYLGHFVLVFSYSFDNNVFSLMDPAGGGSIETCSPEALQVARDQPGTDMDVLLVQAAAANGAEGADAS